VRGEVAGLAIVGIADPLLLRVKRRSFGSGWFLVSGFKFDFGISVIRHEQLETRNMKLETLKRDTRFRAVSRRTVMNNASQEGNR
jgi:hypothetical protein